MHTVNFLVKTIKLYVPHVTFFENLQLLKFKIVDLEILKCLK